MKNTIVFIFSICIMISCTGNTIYKAPENLIPRDTMISLLTDMHIASASKPIKTVKNRRDLNYMQLVYDKYKIDSLRFEQSNTYYTSRIDDYDKLLKSVRTNLEVIASQYQVEKNTRDSIKKKEKELLKKKADSLTPKKSIEAVKDSLIIQEDEE